MVRRTPSTALLAAIAALACAPAAVAAEPTVPESPNVTVGDVSLSGLTYEQAVARLEREVRPALMRKVVVRLGKRREAITGEQAGVKFDAEATARRALAVTPAPDSAASTTEGAASVPVIIDPVVRHSRLAVRAFAQRMAARAGRPARNARVRFGIRRQRVTGARIGLRYDALALAGRIDEAFASPAGSRMVTLEGRRVVPARNVNELRRMFGTIVTVDKSTFTLRLFKHLKWAKSYKVAVGMPAYPTPSGRFRVQNKQVNPTWSVPNSPWAGELAGSRIPGGSPSNPLKARWIGVAGSVGIHGTGDEWSVGSRASHGCIRMRVADVIALYPRVPVGSRVFIR